MMYSQTLARRGSICGSRKGTYGGRISDNTMTFSTPIEDLYFEDYVPGAVHEFGSIVAEEAEMIAFARRFDPQPFHTDPVAAKQSIFAGLIALSQTNWGTLHQIPKNRELV
jgi:hypothetical protein